MLQFDPVALTAPILTVAEAVRAAPDATAVVAQISSGALTVSVATGSIDRETATPAPAQGAYEIGSQTKMMTAVMILQLMEEGKLDLDAKAADYLPSATVEGLAHADQVTLRQLLNMTSGIGNYTDAVDAGGGPLFVDALLAHPDQVFGPEAALAIAKGMEPTGPIGDYYYSNTNYLLLGEIVAGLTGQSFYEALQTRVLDPVGMTHTVRQLDTGDLRLSSYTLDPSTGELVDVTRVLWEMQGEAGVVSTNADMTAFLRALMVDKTLLGAEALAQMTDFAVTGASDVASEGFGLGLASIVLAQGGSFVGFTGGTLGTGSSTYIELGSGAVVAVAGTDAEVNSVVGALTLWVENQGGLWDAPIGHDAVQVASVSAATLAATPLAAGMTLSAAGATLTLDRDIRTISQQNLQFTDGSVLVVGDNSEGRRDDGKANLIDIARDFAAALTHDNHLMGLGGNDTLRGGLGDDRIEGGRGNDVLRGSAGDDFLQGGLGNDRMIGGAGSDTMEGGAGRDVFVFLRASGAVDQIEDFQAGQDRIDLRGLSDLGHWIGANAFSGAAGEVRMAMQGTDLLISEDINGDSLADLTINLGHATGIGPGDFLF